MLKVTCDFSLPAVFSVYRGVADTGFPVQRPLEGPARWLESLTR